MNTLILFVVMCAGINGTVECNIFEPMAWEQPDETSYTECEVLQYGYNIQRNVEHAFCAQPGEV